MPQGGGSGEGEGAAQRNCALRCAAASRERWGAQGLGGRGHGARVRVLTWACCAGVRCVCARCVCVCVRSEFQPKNILFTGGVCVCARARVRARARARKIAARPTRYVVTEAPSSAHRGRFRPPRVCLLSPCAPGCRGMRLHRQPCHQHARGKVPRVQVCQPRLPRQMRFKQERERQHASQVRVPKH